MALTPVEIRHLSPPTGFMGYKRAPTDKLFAEIATSFEDVWRERADLADKVDQLEADIVRYKEIESLLRETLVSAERAASQLKEQARKEAEMILKEAHAEARKVQHDARTENERLVVESRRIKAQLAGALEMIDDAQDAEDAAPKADGDPQNTWPGEHEAAAA
jgi:cell division initiation protein